MKSIHNFSDKKKYNFLREDVIKDIIKATKDKNITIVSTTGMASRELYELRKKVIKIILEIFLQLVVWAMQVKLLLG